MNYRKVNNGEIRFTLLELIVILAILAILVSILMPSLVNARERARRAVCASNLSQTNLLTTKFAKDHKGYYPRGNPEINKDEGVFGLRNHYDKAHPRQLGFLFYLGYLSNKEAEILYCPSWSHPYLQYGKFSYATWGNQGDGLLTETSLTIMWGEFPQVWSTEQQSKIHPC